MDEHKENSRKDMQLRTNRVNVCMYLFTCAYMHNVYVCICAWMCTYIYRYAYVLSHYQAIWTEEKTLPINSPH